MRGLSPQHVELEQKTRAHETRVTERLAQVRLLEEQWDEYRQAVRQNTAAYEEAASALGAKNYFVEKGLAGRRELDGYVGRLADEEAESLAEIARGIRSESEAELERLQREKAGGSWG